MRITIMPVAALALFISTAAFADTVSGDPVRGQKLYGACTGCHSIDDNDVGPKHRGVVGRKAASVPGYTYSPALQNSGIVWTPDKLDLWLANPQKLVPGTKMFINMTNPKDRADIIAYLAQQK